MTSFGRLKNAFQKSLYDNPARLLRFLVTILVLQLAWWVVFYELDHRKTDLVQESLDQVYTAILEDRMDEIEIPPYMMDNGGVVQIPPEILQEREILHWRKLVMLASETFFVILAVTLGARQILHSIEKEKRLLRERDVFISSVTHELKTPLAVILLNTQTMQKRKLTDDKRNTLLSDTVENIHRLENQINNLLLTGDLMNRRNSTEANKLPPLFILQEIQNYLRDTEKQHDREKARIETDFGKLPSNTAIRMDRELFQKVVSNLIENAIQYARIEPRISLRLEQKNRLIEMFVSDNGPGIPVEEKENIFKPFYRLNNDNRMIRGTGMGLHLVREILDSVNGSIQVSETGPEGTTFCVRIPSDPDDNRV